LKMRILRRRKGKRENKWEREERRRRGKE